MSSRPCGSTGTSPWATTSARTPAPTCAIRRPWREHSPGWTPCATRRRWSASATGSPTRRSTSPATISAPPSCSPRRPGRACGGWCSPGRWSSTGRAVTRARGTAWCGRDRAPSPTWTRAGSSPPAPGAARTWPRAWSARTPRPTRATCTPRPSWPRSTWPPPGPGRPARRRCHCATTTCTAPGCPATPRTPASPPSSAPRWPAARRRASSRTAASAGTSCTCGTWPPRTSPRWSPPGRRRAPSAPTTPAAVSRTPWVRWPSPCPPRTAAPSPSSPASTASATSGTSPRTPRACGPTWTGGPGSDSREGMREFARDGLRGD